MQFSSDRTGFPLINFSRLEIQTLPVTKVQFEQFLADSNEFGDKWYEQVLKVSPRISYRGFSERNRERIFITGLLPEEIEVFVNWMGDGFRIPSVSEWRNIYQTISSRTISPQDKKDIISTATSNQAREIIGRLDQQLQTNLWGHFTLMNGGLIEWVKNSDWAGLGVPRYSFHPMLHDPLKDEDRPIRYDVRLHYYGLRLVRHI